MATPPNEPSCLARQVFDAREVVAAYPPLLRHPHKQLVYRIACPPDRPHGGSISVSRWATAPLPVVLPAPDVHLEAARHFFRYEPAVAGSGELPWHLNFADAQLFGFYGGPLLAQDELQVAEHPALGSLREAMEDSDVPHMAPLTTEGGRRTPVLVHGVERRCHIATEPDAKAGRPRGLYGNRFAAADAATVERAVTPIDPPTLTHLIALEAPSCGRGRYTRAQVEDVLGNAYTGFTAARLETVAAGARSAVVHTGFWGCGAYGGNRTLMALLQLAAARLAGVSCLVFHSVDDAGERDYSRALAILEAEAAAGTATASFVDGVAEHGFTWGESDGN